MKLLGREFEGLEIDGDLIRDDLKEKLLTDSRGLLCVQVHQGGTLSLSFHQDRQQ